MLRFVATMELHIVSLEKVYLTRKRVCAFLMFLCSLSFFSPVYLNHILLSELVNMYF